MTDLPARLSQDRHLRQFIKFGIVGGMTTLIYLGLFRLLTVNQVIYPVATAVAFVIATLNSYFFNRRWTFRAGAHRTRLLIRFVIIQTTGFTINLFVLAFLIEALHFSSLNQKFVAAIIANAFIVFTSFVGNKFWTFR